MEVIIYISLVFLLVSCVMAVMSRSLLKSAICLAVASAALGVVMYVLGAKWAAVFEVSVCSGLVTVIFIGAISLSNMKKDDIQKRYDDKKRTRYLPVILIAAGVLMVAAAQAWDFTLPAAVSSSAGEFREVFWNSRQADILGQIAAILVSGIAVVVLFRNDETKK